MEMEAPFDGLLSVTIQALNVNQGTKFGILKTGPTFRLFDETIF